MTCGAAAFHIPLDAKYYTYGTRRVESDNVHQILTYMSGYCSDSAYAPDQREHEVLLVSKRYA